MRAKLDNDKPEIVCRDGAVVEGDTEASRIARQLIRPVEIRVRWRDHDCAAYGGTQIAAIDDGVGN